MTWLPLLLADPSPCLRWLVLRELLGRSDHDPEVRELHPMREGDALVADLLQAQEPEGAWQRGGLAWQFGRLRTTTLALMRLGYLGFDRDDPAVQRGTDYLFSCQLDDGSWPIPRNQEDPEIKEGYSMIPLQTALPLQALAMCGVATDARAERAYDWLLAQRLPDGAWPTGVAAGTYGYVAGYRKLAHSRWGCRSNTTGVLLALAYHPTRRNGPEARRALDLLLGRETREASTLGYEIARLIGAERARGFLTWNARFDLGLVLNLCWRIGATQEDARVAEIVTFVKEQQGPYGLWDYARPQASRWITFDLLRSLSRLDKSGSWVSTEPRTPFQTYPKQPRRY